MWINLTEEGKTTHPPSSFVPQAAAGGTTCAWDKKTSRLCCWCLGHGCCFQGKHRLDWPLGLTGSVLLPLWHHSLWRWLQVPPEPLCLGPVPLAGLANTQGTWGSPAASPGKAWQLLLWSELQMTSDGFVKKLKLWGVGFFASVFVLNVIIKCKEKKKNSY